MDNSAANKEAGLKRLLTEMGSVLVAYSGGADSTYLAAVAHEVLRERAIAVTAVSAIVPAREVDEAREIAEHIGVRHQTIDALEMASSDYVRNAPDRCYHCKTVLFRQLRMIAGELHLSQVLDGSNADDEGDFRPGRRAAAEHGVRSPLQEVGLTKDEVRRLSRVRGLPTWDKPSMACLASRIPYGTPVTREVLSQIEAAENLLHDLGLRQVRVRHHGRTARIEVEPGDMKRLVEERQHVVEGLTALGYVYITLDLAGFRSGSLNEGMARP